nr:DUF6512 family protein [Anaerofilum sp. An201]
MMKTIRSAAVAGTLFTLTAGTLLHFVYEWLGPQGAVIGAVNESTWEHLKLVFWPMLFFSLAEYAVYGRRLRAFWTSRAAGVLAGMAAVVVLFYTYTGVVGRNFVPVDIGIFAVAVLLAWWTAWRMLRRPCAWQRRRWAVWAAVVVLAALTVCFAVFTYWPPHIALFLDPVTGTYGL